MTDAPPLYDLTATLSDGTKLERGAGTPYSHVARSATGKITWCTSEAAAVRVAGKRGMIAPVACSDERYDEWLRSQGRSLHVEPSRPYFAWHGCCSQHTSHRALVKCMWPRHMSVHGDGPFGVYVEHDAEYMSGRKAVWPDIYLYSTLDAATAAHEHWAQCDDDLRKSYVFKLPADPRDADAYRDRTIKGIRVRYGVEA
jgi:hypothetical protein